MNHPSPSRPSSQSSIRPSSSAMKGVLNHMDNVNLTEEMTTDLSDTFRMLDDSKQDKITSKQMLLALHLYGLDIRDYEGDISEDRDDIELEEYMSIMSNLIHRSCNWRKTEIQDLISTFDPDNTGDISVNNVKKFFHEIGECLKIPDISEEMKCNDHSQEDNEEAISYKKFTNVILNIKHE